MCEVLKNGIAIKLAKVIAIITTPAALFGILLKIA